MLSFEEIPDDLVPLTAHFKHLLTLATPEQPILLFLDSVDQLTGVQGNKLSWLPTRLPPNCKVYGVENKIEVMFKYGLIPSCLKIKILNFSFLFVSLFLYYLKEFYQFYR